MEKTKITGIRDMQLDVPPETMKEIARIVESTDIVASIVGLDENDENITVIFEYGVANRDSMMEIVELIEENTYGEEED